MFSEHWGDLMLEEDRQQRRTAASAAPEAHSTPSTAVSGSRSLIFKRDDDSNDGSSWKTRKLHHNDTTPLSFSGSIPRFGHDIAGESARSAASSSSTPYTPSSGPTAALPGGHFPHVVPSPPISTSTTSYNTISRPKRDRSPENRLGERDDRIDADDGSQQRAAVQRRLGLTSHFGGAASRGGGLPRQATGEWGKHNAEGRRIFIPKRIGGRGGAAGGYKGPAQAGVDAGGEEEVIRGPEQQHQLTDSDSGADGGSSAGSTVYQPDVALTSNPTSAEEASSLIARTLREYNEANVVNSVRILGVERCIELLRRTIAAEASGGVLTADGARRRTPGGVYFYFLKEVASKDQYKAVFAAVEKSHLASRNARKKEEHEGRKKAWTGDA